GSGSEQIDEGGHHALPPLVREMVGNGAAGWSHRSTHSSPRRSCSVGGSQNIRHPSGPGCSDGCGSQNITHSGAVSATAIAGPVAEIANGTATVAKREGNEYM